ncbi:MAG: pantetheine-phosphate adenylyltransferase [Muribaculaceae bacterium]|nr:pantetheine-phosphate adenylyltransferase [Muribaculaceae bacterium]
MSDRTILFPGSFDPFTLGHKSLVDRALPLCDRLVIAIGRNAAKPGSVPVEERMERIKALYADEPRVEVMAYDGLTVDACGACGARWMLRGVRTVADYEYERTLATINHELSGIDTLILFTLPGLEAVSSSVVRELASYGKDVSRFLP